MEECSATSALTCGPDGLQRCWWVGAAPDYIAYHDREWGRPITGDDALFERLCLEGFQSGLSWLTILRKRESFRRAFARFRIADVARFDETDVQRLMRDPGIVRNRSKIEAAIANARAAAKLDSLSELVLSYTENRTRAPRTRADIPTATPASTALAKELKRHGFRFVGPTTVYATMQACGIVNDHVAGCWVRRELAETAHG